MSLQSIIVKMTRARVHFEALASLVDEFYKANHNKPVADAEVSAQIGLVCGDCLQNLRSTLDYLVYELVLANGRKPNRKHMFPIATSEDQYRRDLEHKIAGIHPRAAMYIEAVQPFLLSDPKASPLYVLDELTNLNKHRNPLKTTLCVSEVAPLVPFPHMRSVVSKPISGTEAFQKTPLWI